MFDFFKVKILMVNNFNREIEQNVVTNCSICLHFTERTKKTYFHLLRALIINNENTVPESLYSEFNVLGQNKTLLKLHDIRGDIRSDAFRSPVMLYIRMNLHKSLKKLHWIKFKL